MKRMRSKLIFYYLSFKKHVLYFIVLQYQKFRTAIRVEIGTNYLR